MFPAVLAELQKSWSRSNATEWTQVYPGAMPHYQLLIESYQKAQQVAREERIDGFSALMLSFST